MNVLSGLAMATYRQLLMSGPVQGCCYCVSGIFKRLLISRMKGNVELLLYDKHSGRLGSSLSKPVYKMQSLHSLN